LYSWKLNSIMDKEKFSRAKELNKLFFKVFLLIIVGLIILGLIVAFFGKESSNMVGDLLAQLVIERNLFISIFGLLILILTFFHYSKKKEKKDYK